MSDLDRRTQFRLGFLAGVGYSLIRIEDGGDYREGWVAGRRMLRHAVSLFTVKHGLSSAEALKTADTVVRDRCQFCGADMSEHPSEPCPRCNTFRSRPVMHDPAHTTALRKERFGRNDSGELQVWCEACQCYYGPGWPGHGT